MKQGTPTPFGTGLWELFMAGRTPAPAGTEEPHDYSCAFLRMTWAGDGRLSYLFPIWWGQRLSLQQVSSIQMICHIMLPVVQWTLIRSTTFNPCFCAYRDLLSSSLENFSTGLEKGLQCQGGHPLLYASLHSATSFISLGSAKIINADVLRTYGVY